MLITAICPTYNHPQLLANSVRLWEMQSYPARLRRLVILDDGGGFRSQAGDGWELVAAAGRFASLPEKYNALLALAPPETDAFLVWEDDDVYLPDYVAAHARVLRERELSKPSTVLSDYPGRIVVEHADGRFHSTLGFRRELIERIGGWPLTKRADFDQQLIRTLQATAKSRASPWGGVDPRGIQFVYSWHTGAPHGQSTMRSPCDETWYDRAVVASPPRRDAILLPKLDERTRRIMKW